MSDAEGLHLGRVDPDQGALGGHDALDEKVLGDLGAIERAPPLQHELGGLGFPVHRVHLGRDVFDAADREAVAVADFRQIDNLGVFRCGEFKLLLREGKACVLLLLALLLHVFVLVERGVDLPFAEVLDRGPHLGHRHPRLGGDLFDGRGGFRLIVNPSPELGRDSVLRVVILIRHRQIPGGVPLLAADTPKLVDGAADGGQHEVFHGRLLFRAFLTHLVERLDDLLRLVGEFVELRMNALGFGIRDRLPLPQRHFPPVLVDRDVGIKTASHKPLLDGTGVPVPFSSQLLDLLLMDIERFRGLALGLLLVDLFPAAIALCNHTSPVGLDVSPHSRQAARGSPDSVGLLLERGDQLPEPGRLGVDRLSRGLALAQRLEHEVHVGLGLGSNLRRGLGYFLRTLTLPLCSSFFSLDCWGLDSGLPLDRR